MPFRKIREKIFTKTILKRTIFFLLADTVFVALSCWLGFFLRFDGEIPARYLPTLTGFIGLAVPIVLFSFWLSRLYAISWSFVSVGELISLIKATVTSFFVIGAALFILKDHPLFEGFPRSVVFISGFLTLLFTGALRFAKRVYLQVFNGRISREGKKVLIVGAGGAGERLVRHIVASPDTPYFPVGFVDDNPMKQGVSIQGVRVLGGREDIPEIIKREKVEEMIIAMPTATQEAIRQTVNMARKARIKKIKVLPGTREILAEKVTLAHLRDISIEDLLGREKVKIDTQLIRNFVANKKILVTGAAGSIGSHLCRQILKFDPSHLICFDQNETGTFHLERDLNRESPGIPKSFEVGDICDENKVNWFLGVMKPDVVFHAAAYKHVPVMERHPLEAVKNNIFGTLVVARSALEHGVGKFIFVSTDKAVNPTPVMGATKRVGEMVCQWFNGQNKTRFCAVRFGNVLDSQGNVVGIFEEQIKRGGPVEVTHPEMTRYFMVTSEACLLVMQAGTIGRGGEVFVLDMGQPIKIVDLAKEMIRLSGYQPDVDIPIVFTELRPGEKLFEEILTDSEIPTKHERIFVARLADFDERRLLEGLDSLQGALEEGDKSAVVKILKNLVPTYR